MAKRGNTEDQGRPMGPRARVLVVSAGRAEREMLAAQLSSVSVEAVAAASTARAREVLGLQGFDLALVSAKLPDGCGYEFCREVLGARPSMECVLVGEAPTLEDALRAMQAGAADMVASRTPGEALTARVEAALARARVKRQREEETRGRLERARRLCRQLSAARDEVSRQVGSLCEDLTTAYRELAEQMGRVTVGSEFTAIVRQELDIEDLLRAVLEFLLAKVGPTNAAIFLPTGSGDFSLGAYVNYDCPKDTAEVLFDHLADCLAPRFANERELTVLATGEELRARLGENSHWLSDAGLVASPCRVPGGDEECLAVIALFRDRRNPFTAEALGVLSIISPLFAGQLGRVIHCHHRHLPKHKWGLPGNAFTGEGPEALDDDDIDLAA